MLLDTVLVREVVFLPLPCASKREQMTIWCCGPECETLTAQATEQQVRQLRKAQIEYDYVIACTIIHPGRSLVD